MTEQPIAYTAITKGSKVVSMHGHTIGSVEQVLQVPEEDLFDGVVVETDDGIRFVDRDKIDHITTAAVYCNLSAAEIADLPLPNGSPTYHSDPRQDVGGSITARLGRLFRRQHWIKDNEPKE